VTHQIAPSEAHPHTPDSDCLVQLEHVPVGGYTEGVANTVPATNWYQCKYLAKLEKDAPWRGIYQVHRHDTQLVAHDVLDKCPVAP